MVEPNLDVVENLAMVTMETSLLSSFVRYYYKFIPFTFGQIKRSRATFAIVAFGS